MKEEIERHRPLTILDPWRYSDAELAAEWLAEAQILCDEDDQPELENLQYDLSHLDNDDDYAPEIVEDILCDTTDILTSCGYLVYQDTNAWVIYDRAFNGAAALTPRKFGQGKRGGRK